MALPKVIAIVGPTGSGKTALSVRLAKLFNGEIISADSRQIYRGLNIGTDKITQEEMSDIPHHLIDVVGVHETFSVSDFRQLGTLALSDILKRGHIPFVVGGTGFYIQALLENVVLPEVPANPDLRAELEALSPERLFEKLQTLDPDRAKTIERQNKRRLIRAIEVAMELGKVPQTEPVNALYDTLYIGLNVENSVLRKRLKERLLLQLKKGVIEETEMLLTLVPRERVKEFGFQYEITAEHLERSLSRDEMLERLEFELWHYAKRQRTWFKRDKRIRWFRPEQESEMEILVREFINR